MARRPPPSVSGSLIASPVMALSATLVPLVLAGVVLSPVGVLETNLSHGHDCGLVHPDEPVPLRLTVMVHDWGIEVAGEDPLLCGNAVFECPGFQCSATDDYDQAGLAQLLDSLKARHPGESGVVLASDRGVSFETLVTVLDIAHGPGDSRFPFAVLAATPES